MIGLFLTLLGWIGLSPIPLVAQLIGTTDAALKLLISILLGYPLAIIYNKYIIRDYKEYKNIYFIVTGLDIAFYNFGFSMYHNAIPALTIYITTKCFGSGKINVIFTFVFNMTYLLIGYVMTESEDYDITWTMPHCVLTLKLIALSFDQWDGKKMFKEQLSENNKKTALASPPGFLELIGFIYFPACFLVGPIFSFKRYRDFISDKFPVTTQAHVLEHQGMKRLLQGLAYLVAFQVGTSVFDMKYMMSEDFWKTTIIYRHFYSGLWAHFALYKYISCWLLTEASCIRFGLSYNGQEKTGLGELSKWDGCCNIKLMKFEGATKFQHYIDSFNCNTNHFAAEYIYKRLKFLGNRNLSQLFTLLFLALWHGTRSGYYMTFFNEFIIIYMEKELEALIAKTDMYQRLWDSPYKYLLYAVLKTYTIVFMGWSLIPFDLKVFSKWFQLYYCLYFSGFILFVPWAFLYKPGVKKLLKFLSPAKTE